MPKKNIVIAGGGFAGLSSLRRLAALKSRFSGFSKDTDIILIDRKDDFEFLPGVLDSIKTLSEHFKYIIVVSNQQGVGKNLMTHENLEKIHKYMLIEVEKAGGRIDRIYACPHLASAGCDCRKPKNGMFLQAIKESNGFALGSFKRLSTKTDSSS